MKCIECKFYQEIRFRGGECRYEPPREREGRSHWPSVQRDDWCGRFVARDSTATEVVIGTPHIQE